MFFGGKQFEMEKTKRFTIHSALEVSCGKNSASFNPGGKTLDLILDMGISIDRGTPKTMVYLIEMIIFGVFLGPPLKKTYW